MSQKRSDPVDLFCGTAYGLGLSAIVWSLILVPPPLSATSLVLWMLAAVAGIAGGRLRRLGRLPWTLGLSLAAMALHGLGQAVLTAAIAVALNSATRPRRPRHVARQLGCQVGAAAVQSLLAGVVYLALGGPVEAPSWPVAPWPPLAFALTFTLTALVVQRLAMAVAPAGRPRIGLGTRGLRWASALLLGPVLAAGILVVLGASGPGVWIPVGGAVVLGFLLGRAARRQQAAAASPTLPPQLRQCLVQAIARASHGEDPLRKRRHQRVRSRCAELGRRLALTEEELDALDAAACVHEVGRIAVQGDLQPADNAVTVHPGLTDELLAAIALPASTREVVLHRRERFDGHGRPGGLAGDDIPLGSRILATVTAFEELCTKHPGRRRLGLAEARGLLCRESGRIHDPMVIDTLLELLDEHEKQDQQARPVTQPEQPARALPLPEVQQQLHALNEISRITRTVQSLGDLPALLAPHLARLVPHRSMMVHLLGPGEHLEARHGHGPDAESLIGTKMALGDPVSGWVARHRQVAADDDPEVGRTVRPDGLPCATMLAAPLIAADRCWGTLTVYDAPDRRFSQADRRNLIAAAGYLATHAARSHAPSSTPAVHLTDPATGLPSARYLWLELGELIASAPPRPDFALLAFRIGALDELARHEGAVGTERALCWTARRLALECDPEETLVRFGPDLFVILSPQGGADRSLGRWNGLRRRLARAGADLPRPLRIHAGCVRYPEDGTTPQALFDRLQSGLDLALDEGKTVLPFAASS